MMECFPNGQCFEVAEVTTPEPTPEPPAGIYYRRGNTILECFPNGECTVIDIVDPANEEIEYNGDYDSDGNEGDGLSGDGSDGGGADGGGSGANGGGAGGVGGPNGGGSNGPFGAGGPNGGDAGGAGGPNGVGVGNPNEADVWNENEDHGGGVGGKAVCEFKNSAHVQGGIILLEEKTNDRMQVIGKLRGLREGIFVLTFHSEGDVDSPGCQGVGPYHRPSNVTRSHMQRKKRQIELFRLGEKYMENSYHTCMKHVESCKQKKLTQPVCEFYMTKCMPILKCKTCKDRANMEETYDTIGDLEDSGHFRFKSGVPRESLTIYADENGDSNFKEEEREQSLHGPDSVIGRSIVLSALPKDPMGDFRGMACCHIQEGGPTIII